MPDLFPSQPQLGAGSYIGTEMQGSSRHYALRNIGGDYRTSSVSLLSRLQCLHLNNHRNFIFRGLFYSAALNIPFPLTISLFMFFFIHGLTFEVVVPGIRGQHYHY